MHDTIPNDGPSADTARAGKYELMTNTELAAAGEALGRSLDEHAAALDLASDDDPDEDIDDEPGPERVEGLDLDGVMVPASTLEPDEELIDVDRLEQLVRGWLREEFEGLGRRQRERVLAEVRGTAFRESAGVRKALCVRGVAYNWRDSDIRRAFGVPVATLRRWKADPVFVADVTRVRSDRDQMRASLASLLANPPAGTTSATIVDAVKRLEALSRPPLPRTAFQTVRERELWLATL